MNFPLLKPAFFALLALTALLPAHARAQVTPPTLSSGSYTLTADLGAVLLDGRYPFTLSELPALLDVTTSPQGVVSGKAIVFGEPIDVTGKLLATPRRVRLTLRSKIATKNFFLTATQRGSAFVGTANLGRIRVPISIALAGSATARPSYELSLTVSAGGAIRGTGALQLTRQAVPVKVSGNVRRGEASIVVRGAKTFLRVKGPVDAAGFAGRWGAQSFGVLAKGLQLRVSRAAR